MTHSIDAQDILEINNLVARYCQATDDADADAFMRCWVPPERFGGYESGPFGSMKTWHALALDPGVSALTEQPGEG